MRSCIHTKIASIFLVLVGTKNLFYVETKRVINIVFYKYTLMLNLSPNISGSRAFRA